MSSPSGAPAGVRVHRQPSFDHLAWRRHFHAGPLLVLLAIRFADRPSGLVSGWRIVPAVCRWPRMTRRCDAARPYPCFTPARQRPPAQFTVHSMESYP
ncbi:hypothetical protein ACUTAF_17935 [Pseudomonas sp. SP16.1]|uniref:hypothetical protein n=1 Tax=Pseudomonas sp. SP16.1 TaxID=3458854 RepID=UPI004045BC82